METFNHTDRTLVPSMNHVVDWPLVRPALVARHKTADGDVHEQIRALQAQAMTLLHEVRANRDAAAAQQMLYTLGAELTNLRAELAWRKAGASDTSRRTHAGELVNDLRPARLRQAI